MFDPPSKMGNLMTTDLPFAEQVRGTKKNRTSEITTPERTPGVEKVSFIFLHCWEIKVIGCQTFEPNKKKVDSIFFVKRRLVGAELFWRSTCLLLFFCEECHSISKTVPNLMRDFPFFPISMVQKKPILQPTQFIFVEQQLLLIHALKKLVLSVCFYLFKGPNPSTAGWAGPLVILETWN